MKLSAYLLLFILSLVFFSNLNFFLISEELIVFSCSIFFLVLAYSVLRKSFNLYFFNRAYGIYVVFIYLLLVYRSITEDLRGFLLCVYSNLVVTKFKKHVSVLLTYSDFPLFVISLYLSSRNLVNKHSLLNAFVYYYILFAINVKYLHLKEFKTNCKISIY